MDASIPFISSHQQPTTPTNNLPLTPAVFRRLTKNPGVGPSLQWRGE